MFRNLTERYWRTTASILVGFLAVGLGLSAPAQAAALQEQRAFAGEVQLSDQELGELRGGFRLPSGMMLDFALNAQVLVNGTPAFDLNLNSSDVSSAIGQQGNLSQTGIGTGNGTVILTQTGANNFVTGNAFQGFNGFASVIQNTLNGVAIQQNTALSVDIGNFAAAMHQTALSNLLNSTQTLSLP